MDHSPGGDRLAPPLQKRLLACHKRSRVSAARQRAERRRLRAAFQASRADELAGGEDAPEEPFNYDELSEAERDACDQALANWESDAEAGAEAACRIKHRRETRDRLRRMQRWLAYATALDRPAAPTAQRVTRPRSSCGGRRPGGPRRTRSTSSSSSSRGDSDSGDTGPGEPGHSHLAVSYRALGASMNRIGVLR